VIGRLFAAACVVAGVAHADDWQMRAVLGNDAFNGVLSYPDDNGFTNDLALAIRRIHGAYGIGGSILDRMITSSQTEQRCDLVELFATASWVLRPGVFAELRLGPTVVGNLGGFWIQSRWHRLTRTGPHDPHELPSAYPGELRAGGVGGLRLEAGYGAPLRLFGAVDGQVATGETGVTFGEGDAGLDASVHIGPAELGIYGELALARYHVDDVRLAMPGAYRPGWQVDRRIGVHAGWGRYRLSFEYRTNESGSGEAFSMFTLERR
jgi:hypothetical protein